VPTAKLEVLLSLSRLSKAKPTRVGLQFQFATTVGRTNPTLPSKGMSLDTIPIGDAVQQRDVGVIPFIAPLLERSRIPFRCLSKTSSLDSPKQNRIEPESRLLDVHAGGGSHTHALDKPLGTPGELKIIFGKLSDEAKPQRLYQRGRLELDRINFL